LWRFTSAGEPREFADASSLANPMRVVRVPRKSLDELDRESFRAGPSPMDSPFEEVALRSGTADHPPGATVLSLDGAWQMAEEGEQAARLSGAWGDAIPAEVPGSIHTALEKAGKIPDPKFGLNDAKARAKSFETWWFKRVFQRPAGLTGGKLVFGGVAIKCTVWLNGQELGSHEGMFGGPEFDMGSLLKDENTLIVKIFPAPYVEGIGQPNNFFKGMNVGWLYTVVFNNVYGWHYSNIPALGIWRSVRLEGTPKVRLNAPFVATRDAQAGIVDLNCEAEGPDSGWSGRMLGTIEPDNFNGKPYHWSCALTSKEAKKNLHLRFTVPDPRLWWPNDLGEHNLYRLKLSIRPDGGGVTDLKQSTFGLRTVEMVPLPGGPNPRLYNWTFVINKRPQFVKGANWCTMDSSMDFSRSRYDRFIKLAALQHIQMFRAWGSGMPETDEFYDLCNHYGIMVMQEWPTAWNSHKEGWQPYGLLEETVRLNMLRLRNNPSLVMWGGGNESDQPYGKAIDMMGRYSVELDGTRPFHRGEPYGGSSHNYDCDWGERPLDAALKLTAVFFGEFGMRSMPVYESVQRYLPDSEKNVWPASDGGSFAYHTPVFNKMGDMAKLTKFAGYFSKGRTMAEFCAASQVAATTCVRHTLEQARTRWPECAGSLYYKMNDNYPAASWACVDWYGAPKMNHYFFTQTFAPFHACVLFSTFNLVGHPASLPVFLLDDAEALQTGAWKVTVRAFDAKLSLVKAESYPGQGAIGRVARLGEFGLAADQTRSTPLLVVVECRKNGLLADRTFYWLNFEATKDCLFTLPKAKASLRTSDGAVLVTNEGGVPALGVNVSQPGHADTFLAEENFFWLDPGESKRVGVNSTEGLELSGWNL
jgi:beta-mannosidase